MTFLTFGILSVLSGFCVLLLPETLHAALPDTVNEANHLADNSRRFSNLSNNMRSNLNNFDEAGYGKSPEWVEVLNYNMTKM